MYESYSPLPAGYNWKETHSKQQSCHRGCLQGVVRREGDCERSEPIFHRPLRVVPERPLSNATGELRLGRLAYVRGPCAIHQRWKDLTTDNVSRSWDVAMLCEDEYRSPVEQSVNIEL